MQESFRGAAAFLTQGQEKGRWCAPRVKPRPLLPQQVPKAPGVVAGLVGDVVHLPAAVFAHQRVIERRRAFAVAEGHFQFGRVAEDDRRGQPDIAGDAILPGKDRIEIHRLAIRRQALVERLGEIGGIGRGRIVLGRIDRVGIEGFDQRLRRGVVPRLGDGCGQQGEEQGEEEGRHAHG